MTDMRPWIFGLSIEEDLRFRAARYDPDSKKISLKHCDKRDGFLCNLSDAEDSVEIRSKIENCLRSVRDRFAEVFDNTIAVGVSSIGVVDSKKKLILNVDRKKWKKDERGVVIDFSNFISNIGLFKGNPKISVVNDVTAKCSAEYMAQFDENFDREIVQTLFYANFDAGVNGGFVQGNRLRSDSLLGPLNPEIGHIFPYPHRRDIDFKEEFSGCPMHNNCYVALASNTRMFKQWNAQSIKVLRHHEDNPWGIMSHYIAQFCWNAVLALHPQRILLGGSVIAPELVNPIREIFYKINRNKEAMYISTPFIDNPDFIDLATINSNEAGLRAALEVGRSSISSYVNRRYV